jgi:tetratricopeptide (TPR) repeat protein
MIILPLAVLLLLAAPAQATPAEDLAKARDAFRMGNYEEAIPLLNFLLYPSVRLSHIADLVEAHILLGISHFERGSRAEAKREFDEALFLDDSITLDPLLFSEDAIAFFNERKQAYLEQARRDAEARALAEERDRLRQAIENMIVIERKPYYINFVPFGAGQFQNGQDGKGIALFVSQTILGGTSAGLWVWQVGKYGYNGYVPKAEVDTVRRLQQIQIATGLGCLALMVGGIIDSLMHYESSIRRPADESLLPVDLKPHRRDDSSSWKIAPWPSGSGVVMSWEF